MAPRNVVAPGRTDTDEPATLVRVEHRDRPIGADLYRADRREVVDNRHVVEGPFISADIPPLRRPLHEGPDGSAVIPLARPFVVALAPMVDLAEPLALGGRPIVDDR